MTILMGKSLVAVAESAAASQQYTLTVLNQNSRFQQFALFQTIPDIIGPSTNPISLAWMIGSAAPGSITNPSRSKFVWFIDYSATTGYIQELGTTLRPRTFNTATDAAVMVDGPNTLDATYVGTFPNGAPYFPTDPKVGPKGLIIVKSDATIPTAVQQASLQTSINVGIAMNGRPTVAVQLLPNLTYQFTPRPSYFILAGSYVQGQVIDTATSTQAYPVVYSGVTDSTVVFTEWNQFQPS
jgi:rhizosphere induced protein